jgi:hypothetical protein
MKNYRNMSTTAALLYLALIVAFIYGWIANIVMIAQSDLSTITGMLILRVAGIFVAPLGAILGYV